MDEFKPDATAETDCMRRIYNGIRSEYIAALVQAALTHALNDPAFRAKIGTLGTQNLMVLFED